MPLGSRFDVWRRRSTTPTDARPSCRAFFYVVTAAPSFDPRPIAIDHACFMPASTGSDGIIAAKILHRKAWRFVLSNRNAENRSCFRVGIAAPFVLSSRNGLRGFVLSNRNVASHSCFRVGIAWQARIRKQGRGVSAAHDQAGASAASFASSARRVMTTLAEVERRPALRGPSSTIAAGASSIRRMS